MKSFDEKIAELQEKQQQLKAQEKALRAKQSEEERKERTRRLIQAGAAVESVISQPAEGIALEEVLEILRQTNLSSDDQILQRTGGIVQSVVGRSLTFDDLPKLRSWLESQESRGGYLSRALLR